MEPIIVTAKFDPNPAGRGVTLLRVALDAETSPGGVVHQSGSSGPGRCSPWRLYRCEAKSTVSGMPLTYDAAQRCYVAEIPAGETSRSARRLVQRDSGGLQRCRQHRLN